MHTLISNKKKKKNNGRLKMVINCLATTQCHYRLVVATDRMKSQSGYAGREGGLLKKWDEIIVDMTNACRLE